MAAATGSTTFVRGLAVHDIQKALFFAVCGAVGAFAGDFAFEPIQDWFRDSASRAEAVGYWFALIGAGTALAIALGLGRYLRGRIVFDRRVALTVAIGLAAGYAGGYVGQVLLFAGSYRRRIGTYLAAAGDRPDPVLGHRRGHSRRGAWSADPEPRSSPRNDWGGIGGLLGGALFVAIVTSADNNVLGRVAGTSGIGGLIGLMIVLADAALREAWLEVIYGQREKRTVSLGAQPVSVGSGRECTVYASNAASTAFTFRLEKGRILVDDAAAGRTDEMRPGEARRIGDIELVVHGAGGAPAMPAGTPAASTPVTSSKASPSPPRPSPASVRSSQATQRPSQSPSGKGSPAAFLLRMSQGGEVRLTVGQGLSGRQIPGLEPGYAGGHVADIVAAPSQANVIALRNLSHSTWKAEMPDGSSRSIGQGQAIAVAAGVRLNFGSSYGEIG